MSLPITHSEDIGFKLAPREVQLFDPIEGDSISTDDEYRCLAMANRSGFFAACSAGDVCIGRISDLSKTISEDSDTQLNVSTVKAPNPISCLAFSQDQQKLYMSAGAIVYRVNYVSPELERVTELSGHIKQMTPWGVEMLALTEGGTLYLIEKDKSHTSMHGSVSAFCVCASGIIVGNKSNSSVEILSSQGKVKQTFESPCQGSVVHVASITNTNFLVVYGEEEYEFKTFIADISNKVLKEAEDVCPPYGMIPRKWTYYTEVLHGWSPRNRSLVFVGSGPSTDISIMTPEEVVVPSNETEMAQIPISEKTDEDLTLMGMALDVCATDKVLEPCKGVDECSPLPRLWALTNEGFLLCWHVFDRQGLRDGDLDLSKAVVGEGLVDEEEINASPDQKEGVQNKIEEKIQHEAVPKKVEQKTQNERLATFGSQVQSVQTEGEAMSTSAQPTFGSSGFGSTAGQSAFRSTFDKPAFGSSGFGTSDKPAFGSSGFGTSGFGTSGQPAFGSSGFGATDQKPAFGSSAFGSSAFGSSAFGSSAFGQKATSGQPSFGESGFGKFGSNTDSPFSTLTQKESPFSSLGSVKSPFGAFGTQPQGGSPFGAFANQTLPKPPSVPSVEEPSAGEAKQNDEEPSLLPGKDEKESPFVNISDSKELSSPDESFKNLEEENDSLASEIDNIGDLSVAEGDDKKGLNVSENDGVNDSNQADLKVESEQLVSLEIPVNEEQDTAVKSEDIHSGESVAEDENDLQSETEAGEELERDVPKLEHGEEVMDSKEEIKSEEEFKGESEPEKEIEPEKKSSDESTPDEVIKEEAHDLNRDIVSEKEVEPREKVEPKEEVEPEGEVGSTKKTEPDEEMESKDKVKSSKSTELEKESKPRKEIESQHAIQPTEETNQEQLSSDESETSQTTQTPKPKVVDAVTQVAPSVDQSIQTLTEQTSSLGLQTDSPLGKVVQSFENDELYASEQNAPSSVPPYLTLEKVVYPPMSDDKVLAAIEKICYDTDAELELLRMNVTQLDPYLEDHHNVFPEHTEVSLGVPGQWRLGEAVKVSEMVDDEFGQMKLDVAKLTELESSSLDLKGKTASLIKSVDELQEEAYQLQQFTEKNARFNDRPLNLANHTVQKSLRLKNKSIESKLKMFESKMLILKANAQFGMLADKPKALESAVSRIGIVLKDHLANLKQLRVEVSNLESLALPEAASSRQLLPRKEVEKVQLSDLEALRDVKRQIAEAVKKRQSEKRVV